MKKTIDLNEFVQTFKDFGREDNFSKAGLEALFNWFEELEDSSGTEIEFDCIAICCEFTEFESLEEFHNNFDSEEFPDLETVQEHTTVIEIDNDAFIIADF